MTTETLLRATKQALLSAHDESEVEGWASAADLLQLLGVGANLDSLQGALTLMVFDDKIEVRDSPVGQLTRQYRIRPSEVEGVRRGIELLNSPRAKQGSLPAAA